MECSKVDYICVSEHCTVQNNLVEIKKIFNLIRAERFTSLHRILCSQCKNEFDKNDNALLCKDSHYLHYLHYRALLITVMFQIQNVGVDRCPDGDSLPWDVQGRAWSEIFPPGGGLDFREGLSPHLISPLTLTDPLYICAGAQQEQHFTETTKHSEHWHSQVCYIVYCSLGSGDKPDEGSILTRSTSFLQVGGGVSYI